MRAFVILRDKFCECIFIFQKMLKRNSLRKKLKQSSSPDLNWKGNEF